MESQKLNDLICESEESSLDISGVPDSAATLSADVCELHPSSDSNSKDSCNQIQHCSSSLLEERSQNSLVSSADSLPCLSGISGTDGNEDSNSKSFAGQVSDLASASQNSTDSTSVNAVSTQQMSSSCEDLSPSKANDIHDNEVLATGMKVATFSSGLCNVKKEEKDSLEKSSESDVAECKRNPVNLSATDAVDVENSSSESLETDDGKPCVKTIDSLCADENSECVPEVFTPEARKPEIPASEINLNADDTSPIKIVYSNVVVKSEPIDVDSCNESDQSASNANNSALDMTVSSCKDVSLKTKNEPREIEDQDLSLELSGSKDVDSVASFNKVSDNHCDPKSPKSCDKSFTQDQSDSSTSSNNSLEQVVTKCLSENDKLSDLHEVVKPVVSESHVSKMDTSENQTMPESPFSNVVDQTSETKNMEYGAVDLTKAQCNSAVSEQNLSPTKIGSETLEKSVDSVAEDVSQPLSREETGLPEFFDDLVTVGRYVSVKGDFTLRSCEALIESPSVVSPFLLKEPDIFPVREQPLKTEGKAFFQSSVGEFLIGLGLSRCNEWYYRDLVHMKARQIRKEGKTPELEENLKTLQSSYLQAKMANEPYVFSKKTCSACSFNTESTLVLEGHMLVPHLISPREYECGFCSYIHRDPRSILNHMKTEHNKVGRIEAPSSNYQCPNCLFECNTRIKFGNHLNRCANYHNRTTVQIPPKDFEFPCLTPKPITVAVVKAYEKSLSNMQNRYKKPRKGENAFDMYPTHFNQQPDSLRLNPPYDSNYNMGLPDGVPPGAPPGFPHKSGRPVHPSFVGSGMGHMPYQQGNKYFQASSNGSALYSPLSNNAAASSFPFPFLPNPSQKGAANQSFKGMFSPSLPQLPKLQGPYPMPGDKSSASSQLQSNNLVVCEICDGYIKDMEQLRTHMQLIHKVKIHPKVLSSRPPLNCQKCQWRFFTDQGLERHLLGAHGLVTSNMQDMANKNKDSGCCTICGRVFASKLVIHMNQIHKVTLKPAHLSYKCTVCSATFNLYRLFENHVYLVHSSSSSKRSAENSDVMPSKKVARASNWEPSSVSRDKHLRYLAEKENGAA